MYIRNKFVTIVTCIFVKFLNKKPYGIYNVHLYNY